MTKITPSKTRLDRFISQKMKINKRDVKLILAQKRVAVDGVIATDVQQIIHSFSKVEFDGISLQNKQACYLMLNKPLGVVSATRDELHKTVIDLLDHPLKESLHIAGRLDLNSTGLLLLTNDSHWSRQLMHPLHNKTKTYLVTTQNPIKTEYIEAFDTGLYFPFEGITTKPVKLTIKDLYTAELTLTEGKYHQIKRMFGRFQNPVISIHRTAIGHISLDPSLLPGQFRVLDSDEIRLG